MCVIGHEGPGIALCFCFGQEIRKSFHEIFTVFIVFEDPAAFYPPDHHMV
jgi:hypothetical protein